MKEITLKIYSVEEKLPEMFPAHDPEDWENPENRYSRFVMAKDADGNVAKAKYIKLDGRESWCRVDILPLNEKKVTHWMELPFADQIGD